MVRTIPSTLHRCVKFEWGRIEVTIRGELSHPIHSVNSIPITDELDEDTFHILEIMQAIRVSRASGGKIVKCSKNGCIGNVEVWL